jgi:uncharacterized integral membrane protein
MAPDNHDSNGGHPPANVGRRIKLVVIAAAVALLVAFAVQNRNTVPVDFVFFDRHPRLIVVIVVAAVLGFVVGFAAGRPNRRD